MTRLYGAIVALIALGATACASSGTTPRPKPFPGAPVPTPSTPPPVTAPVAPSVDEEGLLAHSPSAEALVSTALGLRGVPYRNGGSDPSGFDCSGLIQWVFAQNGIRVPREVKEQFEVGTTVNRQEVRPGDLLFFETVSDGASHVGLAIGGDRFVHAPSSRGVVRVERFTTNYWAARFVGAKRVE